MAKLLKVLRVEIRESVVETVRKIKRHDYARGGYRIEEIIHRETVATPFALLECGHWRREYNSGAVVSTAKRLSCHKCEQEEYERQKVENEASFFNSTTLDVA